MDEDGRVLAAASYTGNEALNLGLLYRHPDAPGGLGRQAMRAMLQDALSRDECMTVMLQVRNENVLARRLYERLGFITLDGDSTQLYLMGKQGIRSAIARIHNQL